jgi:hypothetical protein
MGLKNAICQLAFLLAALLPVGAIHAQTESTPPDSPPTAHQLVKRLGDPRFSIRERATNELVLLGSDAIGALEEGCHASDREVRFRSQRVLEIVREYDFQRRLERFADGRDDADGSGLPSWERFRYDVGENRPARTLFVEMQKSEPELLRTLNDSPEKVADALSLRVAEIQSSLQYQRTNAQLDLGSIAAVLFVYNNSHAKADLRTAQAITYFLKQNSFTSALQTGSERELLRKMLSQWIEQSEGWMAYQGMTMALQFGLPSGLVTAKRLLNQPPDPNLAYARWYALITMARFGSLDDLELIESFLDDTTPYGTTVRVNRQVKYRTQMRDVALAALVHLTKQKFADYGFDRLRAQPTFVFDLNSIAFENDEKRDEAIKRWREHRAKEAAETPAKQDS